MPPLLLLKKKLLLPTPWLPLLKKPLPLLKKP